jgi:beta-lactamase superfamily II metal-dependent hydrolase
MDKSPICECWFLDVGQGASNVILLPNNRAIVIDCGPKGSNETIQLLKRYTDTLEALIITHNHSDHDGNVAEVLYAFPKAVRRIFFLRDKHASKIEMVRSLAILGADNKESYPEPARLEADIAGEKVLFEEGDLNLSVLYPTFSDNLISEGAGARSQNYTSSIIKLSCGTRRVIFSGDTTIEAWESLASKVKENKPLLCDIMTVPHHGGKISNSYEAEHASQERLYSEIIKPDYGIVSVGTRNPDNHPTQEAISALKKAGIRVLCTQMTSKCSTDLEAIRSLRRTISRPARSTHSESRSAGDYSRHVACFGSVIAEISPQAVRISNLASFEQDMVSFCQVPSFTPICKPLN